MIDWFSQHGIEFAAFVLTLVVTVVKHSVANNNPFDAKDVRVELSNGNEYELGDISRGSESSFLFLERGLEVGTNDDVRITWALPDDPSHRFSVTKPVPPCRQS